MGPHRQIMPLFVHAGLFITQFSISKGFSQTSFPHTVKFRIKQINIYTDIINEMVPYLSLKP